MIKPDKEPCVDCGGPRSYGSGKRCRECYRKRSVAKKKIKRLEKHTKWINFDPDFVYQLHHILEAVAPIHPKVRKARNKVRKALRHHEEVKRVIEYQLKLLD